MENLFEAQYIRTEADHKAWFSYLFWKRPVILVLNCVLALGFIANLISLIIFVEEIFYVRMLVPLYFALQILNYCRAVKIAAARDKETFAGKPISIHIGISEDTIHYTFVDVRSLTNIIRTRLRVRLIGSGIIIVIDGRQPIGFLCFA